MLGYKVGVYLSLPYYKVIVPFPTNGGQELQLLCIIDNTW